MIVRTRSAGPATGPSCAFSHPDRLRQLLHAWTNVSVGDGAAAAGLEQNETRAHLDEIVKPMGGDQERRPRVPPAPQGLAQPCSCHRIESLPGLIQHEQIRGSSQDHTQAEELPAAAGERPNTPALRTRRAE